MRSINKAVYILPVLLSSIAAARYLDKRIIDDAYITYRYATNLLAGGQLVFNIDDYVEAQTNILWSLIMAACGGAGFSMPHAAVLISFICFILFLRNAYDILSVGDKKIHPALLLALFIPFGGSLFANVYSGMETVFYAFLISQAFIFLESEKRMHLSVICGLIFMTRPEGFFVGIIFISAAVYYSRFEKRAILEASIVFIIIFVAVSFFRAYYYGSIIPNSIIAKSLPIDIVIDSINSLSIPYIINFFIDNPIMFVGCFLFFSLAVTAEDNRLFSDDKNSMALVSEVAAFFMILLSLAIVVRNGGDWMPNSRLLSQYTVCYLVVGRAAIRGIELPYLKKSILIIGVVVIVIKSIYLFGFDGNSLEPDIVPDKFYDEAAMEIKRLDIGADSFISSEAAGYLPYKLINNRIHDPLGLADKYLARHGSPGAALGRTDLSYTMGSIRPAVAIWHYVAHLYNIKEEFLKEYRFYCHRDCQNRRYAGIVMIRKDVSIPKDSFMGWASGREIKVINDLVNDVRCSQ